MHISFVLCYTCRGSVNNAVQQWCASDVVVVQHQADDDNVVILCR